MASTLILNGTRTNAGEYGTSKVALEYKLTTTLTAAIDVNDYLAANLPATFTYATGFPLYRENFESDPIGGGVWDVVSNYALPKGENVEIVLSGPEYSYDGGVETFTLHRAITENKYSPNAGTFIGKAAPSMQRNINWTDEGIQGTAVYVPNLSFTLKKTHAAGTFTVGVLRSLALMQRSVNHATWKGFAAHEILFLSFTVDRRDDGKEVSTAKFIFSPNSSDINAADSDGNKPYPDFGVIPKKGHEYLWQLTQNRVDPATGYPYMETRGIYVNKIYQSNNFTNLALLS